MAWPEQMRPASFRGVPFFIEGTTHTFGRRLQREDLIGVDGAQYTDFGKDAQIYTIEAFLVGDDYIEERDALVDALLVEGPAQLVLSTRGGIRARIIDRPEAREQRGQLGYCVVSFTAVSEPEAKRRPTIGTAGRLSAAAQAMSDTAETSALETYSLDGVPDSQRGGVLDSLNDVTSSMRQVNGRISSSLQVLEDTSVAINNFEDQLEGILNAPQTVVSGVVGIVTNIVGLADTVASGIDRATGLPFALAAANPFESSRPARSLNSHIGPLTLSGTTADPKRRAEGTVSAIPDTPAEAITATRKQAAAAAHTVYTLTRAATVANVADVASRMEFDSVEQADSMLGLISESVDSLFTAPPETLTSDLLEAAEDMRAAAYAHLRSVSRGLEHLRTHRPRATMPMVLISQDLYDGDVTRENELIARNPNQHPLFVEVHTDLEVLR